MTGGVIGLVIGGPLAIPVALASHFALDALPHFGFDKTKDRAKNRNRFIAAFVADAVVVALLFSAALLFGGVPWYVLASAFVAMTPDVVWIYRFIFEGKLGKIKASPLKGLNKWHSDIQTSEAPNEIWVELAWFPLMLVAALSLLSQYHG